MKALFIFVILFGLLGCDYPGRVSGPYAIYKTKGDYDDFLSIGYSKEESRINCYPGPADLKGYIPIDLAEGYRLAEIYHDFVFTDIHLNDWERIWDSINANNVSTLQYLSEHIIDFDPFLEYYSDFEDIIGYNPDTSILNKIIRDKELIKYFERVK